MCERVRERVETAILPGMCVRANESGVRAREKERVCVYMCVSNTHLPLEHDEKLLQCLLLRNERGEVSVCACERACASACARVYEYRVVYTKGEG